MCQKTWMLNHTSLRTSDLTLMFHLLHSVSSDEFSGKDVQLVFTCEMECFIDLRNKWSADENPTYNFWQYSQECFGFLSLISPLINQSLFSSFVPSWWGRRRHWCTWFQVYVCDNIFVYMFCKISYITEGFPYILCTPVLTKKYHTTFNSDFLHRNTYILPELWDIFCTSIKSTNIKSEHLTWK